MGYDSVDVWANQGEFQLDENLTPIKVQVYHLMHSLMRDRNGEILFMIMIKWKQMDSAGEKENGSFSKTI